MAEQSPTERIAATLVPIWQEAALHGGPFVGPGDFIAEASMFLDALCPPGERVVLDRRDGDRLIRQRKFSIAMHGSPVVDAWADIDEGDTP